MSNPESMMERLSDQHRIALMLRADGWGYDEIAAFIGLPIRTVRHLLAQATRSYPGILDHRRPESPGRLMRLVYLMGVADGMHHGDPTGTDRDMIDALDMLVERARWLRIRIDNQHKMASSIK